MFTYWLAEKLRSTRITANCIRVTNVKIDINRYPDISLLSRLAYRIKSSFSITPEEMAEVYTYFAVSADVAGLTGKYFDHHKKAVRSSDYSCDKGEH